VSGIGFVMAAVKSCSHANDWMAMRVGGGVFYCWEGDRRLATRLQVHSPAIECEGCANAIRRSLGKLEGVINVVVDVANKNVSVEYRPEEAKEGAIRERLAEAGFPAEP
jgi:copper chaperone CopZ